MKKTNWSDDDIKTLFQEEKERDFKQIPSFKETMATVDGKMQKKNTKVVWFSFAASIVILISIGAYLFISNQQTQVNNQCVEIQKYEEDISVWDSPTAILLSTNHDFTDLDILLDANFFNEGLEDISLSQWKSKTDFLLSPYNETKN